MADFAGALLTVFFTNIGAGLAAGLREMAAAGWAAGFFTALGAGFLATDFFTDAALGDGFAVGLATARTAGFLAPPLPGWAFLTCATFFTAVVFFTAAGFLAIGFCMILPGAFLATAGFFKGFAVGFFVVFGFAADNFFADAFFVADGFATGFFAGIFFAEDLAMHAPFSEISPTIGRR